MKLPAFMILEGDLIDLEGDPFADPNSDNAAFKCLLQEVVEVNEETDGCVSIGFEGFDLVGFPRNHLLDVKASKI